jgi:hypothetical protein
MEKAVAAMLKAHRCRDAAQESPEDECRAKARRERLQGEAQRIREFLATHEERRSEKGAIRKSNVTDNDSAKMATSKGVIQGYTAVAAVDSKAQIIVAARAHGSGSEQSVLLPMVESTSALRTDQTIVTADAGYHSEEKPQGAVRARGAGTDCRRPHASALCPLCRARPLQSASRSTLRQRGGREAFHRTVHAGRFHLRRHRKDLRVPGGQEALFQRQRMHDQRPQASQVQGRQA